MPFQLNRMGVPNPVSARWTLVDRYERDGRRYIVAREGAARTRGAAALSERERQVVALASLGRSNKLIAYELGPAHATTRVMKKTCRWRRRAVDHCRDGGRDHTSQEQGTCHGDCC